MADPACETRPPPLAEALERTIPHTESEPALERPKSILHPVAQDLRDWVYASQDRLENFEMAISSATSQNVIELGDIHTLTDWFSSISALQTWIPTESIDGTEIFNRFCVLWFILSQPSILPYQDPLRLGTSKAQNGCRSFLSQWIVEFSTSFGAFMDTPGSLEPSTLSTFAASPSYHLSDYLSPRGGWRNFNEFFARRLKPGLRPIDNIGSNHTIVSPCDFAFCGQMPVSPESTIETKGLTWSLGELLADSSFAGGGRFAGGIWMHGFLGTGDYHRVHSPVAGKVIDSRIVRGQNYALIEAVEVDTESGVPPKQLNGIAPQKTPPKTPVVGQKSLRKRRIFSSQNESGFQFLQSRGLVILDTDIGLVAVILVGMAVVSSVILTCDVGVTLHKGEEIGFFQFGGSDVAVVFENAVRQVEVSAALGMSYKMGEKIGHARPGSSR